MSLSERDEDGKSQKCHTLLKPLHLLPKKVFIPKIAFSYLSLFRPLQDVQSRLILFCGVVLAIAAGAPLPIIGVIFARIIDSFPPTEDEIRTRVYQLLVVGTYTNRHVYCLSLVLTQLLAIIYFIITWGWAFCWGIVGARVSRGLRTQMVDRALGLDQTYYETICPDVCGRLQSRHINLLTLL
jgi:ATP-binding cassette subfamily B (MDR/TAP) protein 1